MSVIRAIPLCIVVLGCSAAAQVHAQSRTGEPVDMLLCLAADVSASVTGEEFTLQRNGHATAIRDPQTIDAIRSGLHGKIAVAYVEWARPDQQFLSVNWHAIDDEASARRFADAVNTSPSPPWINFPIRNTSTGDAIRFCQKQFAVSPYVSDRLVIDISSNGTSNVGAKTSIVRDQAVGQGVVINVLAVTSPINAAHSFGHTRPKGGLVRYFEENVVGGRGSFVEEVDGYEAFADMIVRKFLLEIASSSATQQTR